MAEFIKNWIISIIALVLFVVLLEIIIPAGKIRKFVNLVTGFILIIAIINPFVRLFKGGISLESFQLAGSSEVQRLEIEKNSKRYKEEQMQQIVEVYRQKVIKQLEKTASETKGVASAQADVIINEDYNSENFGEIKRAYVNIVPENGAEKTRPVDSIQKVKVKLEAVPLDRNGGGTSEKEGKEADNTGIDGKVVKSIEDKVGRLFNLEPEDIVIGLQEG